MSEKQIGDLMDEFAKSSQCLTLLQEGILSLHGVMEQFQKAAADFTVKNEIDTLLPKVHQHFSQANDIYSSIADKLQEIQSHTQAIESTGQLYSTEMVPAYQKLQTEVQQLTDMQQGMVDMTTEISEQVQQMHTMQQQLNLQMVEYRQMITESHQLQQQFITIAEQNLVMNAFLEKMKGADRVATEYFTAICQQWQQAHLNEAIEKWAEENLDEMIKKKIKSAFSLQWK